MDCYDLGKFSNNLKEYRVYWKPWKNTTTKMEKLDDLSLTENELIRFLFKKGV